MTNKQASSIQEKQVAIILGGSVVSGSGARAGHPGDVTLDKYIVECKTHTKPDHRVVFKDSVWRKLKHEAFGVFKYPVLVVDDGSQRIDHTWCMISKECIPEYANIIPTVNDNKSSVSFSHVDMYVMYKSHKELYKSPMLLYHYTLGHDSVYVTPLMEFSRFIKGDL